MNLCKAALFDLDGTLFDTEPQYTVFWKRVGEQYHPENPDLHNCIKGMTLDAILDSYFPEDKDREDIVAMLNEWERNMKYDYVEGACDFIADLKKNNVKCAIVTSSNNYKVECLKSKVSNVDLLFDYIITSEMFKRSKPYPDAYIKAAEMIGVKVKDCVVFEDAFNGLKAAKNANMFTIGLTTTNDEQSIKELCDFTVKNYSGLDYLSVIQLLNNIKH